MSAVFLIALCIAHTSALTISAAEHAITDTIIHVTGGNNSDAGAIHFVLLHPCLILTFIPSSRQWAICDSATRSKVVGVDSGSCIRTMVGLAWHCTLTATLFEFHSSQMVISGILWDSRPSVAPVVGGTGKFVGVTGVTHISVKDDKDYYDFVFDVTTAH